MVGFDVGRAAVTRGRPWRRMAAAGQLRFGAPEQHLVAATQQRRQVLAGQLGRGRERGAQRLDPGEPHLPLHRAVVLELERVDEGPQRHALDHERPEHDGEGGEQDQIAVGKRGPVAPPVGSASAAASVTVPRMPHHATTAAAFLDRPTASWRAAVPSGAGRHHQRLTAAAPDTQANRARIVAAHTAAAMPAYSVSVSSRSGRGSPSAGTPRG